MIRIAIAGPQDSGKSQIAEGLAALLRACGKRVAIEDATHVESVAEVDVVIRVYHLPEPRS